MTGLEIRVLVYGLLALALASGGWYVKSRLDAAKAAETQVTTLEGQAQGTSRTTGAAQAAVADAQRVEIVVTEARAQAQRATEELSHADPTVAGWRAGPVPDGLRRIARERREARERGAADRPAGAGAGG